MREQHTILDRIVNEKERWLHQRMQSQPLNTFIDLVYPSDRHFYEALSTKPAKFILECKKASPSKGLIRDDFNPSEIAKIYGNYAAAISVLTDEAFFQGDFAYIAQVREQVSQPVLCKDFIIDEYQVYLARHQQADAILLMLSVLDDNEYRVLSALAHKLNMGVLTEVSNHDELQRALLLNAKVIGINNRDLRDLSIDLNRTIELAKHIPDDRIVISESGIYQHAQVRKLAKHANGFLVGSSLMAQRDIDMACRKLIYGENKVCGLSQPKDVQAVYAAGAVYGGLIFAEHSPRRVTLKQAQSLVSAAPLQFVGVFVNQALEFVAQTAAALNLSAVQLHGQENNDYVQQLKSLLPNTAIWQAVAVDNSFEPVALLDNKADRILFDSKHQGQFGGTGLAFDWHKVAGLLEHAMLAGGLNKDNAVAAAELYPRGLDFNSGLEQAPAIKDHDKINAAFAALRNY